MDNSTEFEEGYRAFSRTFNRANPHSVGTPEFAAWELGFQEALMDHAI
jgi:hypothetical protein